MTELRRIGITGVGYALPAEIRTNDDPVFDWIKKNTPSGMDLFKGYEQRRVLAPGEDLMTIMLPAAQRAMEQAGIQAQQVDLLMGCASFGSYVLPNGLANLHKQLNLYETCTILPVQNEFNNLNSCIELAHAMIRAGRANHVLIAVGSDWTRYVDYHTSPSVSASDGAAALVIGRTADASKFTFIDAITVADSKDFGAMYMQGDPAGTKEIDGQTWQLTTTPFFHLTPQGQEVFKVFGLQKPPVAVAALLKRNNVDSSQVALISHQASSVLMNAWNNSIRPGQYINTITTFANMTAATIAVNLASAYDRIEKDYLVLLGIGLEIQSTVVLLKRTKPRGSRKKA